MTRDIAIYGAGGLGREVALMIRQLNDAGAGWNILGFFDDLKDKGSFIDGVQVLGNSNEINKLTQPLALAIAIADPKLRARLVKNIKNDRVSFPTLIHPLAIAGDPDNIFGEGTIITAGSILTTGIILSPFVIINLATTIGHDVKIGTYTSVMPSVNISGNVSIGNHAFVGTGAKILQNLTIGDNAIVGAGAVVTRSVENNETVVGVPARKIKRK